MSTEPAVVTLRRSWSPTAAAIYRSCPRKWSYRHGPHREQARAAARSGGAEPVYRARGRVLHACIAAAYNAAAAELAHTPAGLVGARMDRYWPHARVALGKAWETERMPSDPDEVLECIGLLRGLLETLMVPAPGAIYGVEARIQACTSNGVPVTIVLDLALWTSVPGVLRVVDHKSGEITLDDVMRSQQLLIYADVLAHLDEKITGLEVELHSIRDRRGHWYAPTPEQVREAVDRLRRTAEAAEADLDPAPRPGPGCAGCWFARICPAVGRRA